MLTMDQLSGFIFLADDTKLVFVQFKPMAKSGGEPSLKNGEEKLNGRNLVL